MLSEISQAAYILLLFLFIPFPYATDRRIQRTPWVTCGLILVNFVVFFCFIVPSLGTTHENDIFDLWGVTPRSPGLINLVTYLFLHVSVAHVLWNSAFLWLFGPSGEDALGHVPYLTFYIVGGVVAGLLHTAIVLLFAQNSAAAYSPMVGASGAISAVIGLYALRFYRSKLKMVWGCALFLQLRTAKFELPAIAGLGLWFLQNLFGAVYALFQPDRNGIAYWAHIGGFIFGMTVAEVFGMLRDGMREYLFADAVNAGEQGEEGVRSAVSNFHLLLQHRPDDDEVREALALLAQQSTTEGSKVMKEAVSEAYSMLLDQSMATGDMVRTKEWLSAFKELNADDILPSSALLRLAGRAASFGDDVFADGLYAKVMERFPDSREWEYALLDSASLRLETQESPKSAIGLLARSLDSKTSATTGVPATAKAPLLERLHWGRMRRLK
jgi:membrane associated rhomboid family serine protease